MGACLRYARRHRSRTGTNPAVGTLLVKDGIVVGRGITALGGRPHAERVALDEAGARSVGATAYVTLEPCAHHGATPPCAQGVDRRWYDPRRRGICRPRWSCGRARLCDAAGCRDRGRGRYRRAAGGDDLTGYLHRKQANRPAVTLETRCVGRWQTGIAGSGSEHNRMRWRAHMATGCGRNTTRSPLAAARWRRMTRILTCRLPGLEGRSPHRFVFARFARRHNTAGPFG